MSGTKNTKNSSEAMRLERIILFSYCKASAFTCEASKDLTKDQAPGTYSDLVVIIVNGKHKLGIDLCKRMFSKTNGYTVCTPAANQKGNYPKQKR